MYRLLINQICFLVLITSCKTNIDQTRPNLNRNDTLAKIDTYLKSLEKDKNFSGGLLIVKNGQKIFSKGYGYADKERNIKFSPSTPASMGSITKAFTAAGIMKLVELGKVTLTDNLKKFFRDVPADKESITLKQLLTHSSGFVEFLKEDGGDYERINTTQFLKRAFDSPLSFKPGEKGVYTNVGMSLLGIIIEKVSGMEYEAFLKKYLFDRAGIKTGYYYDGSNKDSLAVGYQEGKRWGTHSQHFKDAGGGPYWNLKANGGLEASLDDMYKWTSAISSYTILSKQSVDSMFAPSIMEEGYNGKSYFGYGCNISKSKRGTKVIDNGGSNGIYYARLVRMPLEGMIFYMVTNESSINTNMVLPNVSQIYFEGKIVQDATGSERIQQPMVKRVLEILNKSGVTDLGEALKMENIKIDDDMILLNAGMDLTAEKQYDKAMVLYKYYTTAFPKIVVSWNELAELYLRKGNKEDAKRCFSMALKLRPGNPRARTGLEKVGK